MRSVVEIHNAAGVHAKPTQQAWHSQCCSLVHAQQHCKHSKRGIQYYAFQDSFLSVLYGVMRVVAESMVR
jgi:hypothetical protein